MKEYKCICKVCGVDFISYSTGITYCNSCKTQERECVVCGKTFTWSSKRPTQKSCSRECARDKSRRDLMTDRYIIFERDGFRCSYCGKNSVQSDISLVVDHIYPVDAGGPNTAENLITACSTCNSYKHNKIMSEANMELVVREVRRRNKERGIDNKKLIKLGSR